MSDTTRQIRLKILLDNAQFLAAAGGVGASASSMGTNIRAGASAASAALDAASASARGVGVGMEAGSRTAQSALSATTRAAVAAAQAQAAALETAARMRQQQAAAQATADAAATAAAQRAASSRLASAQAEAVATAERLRAAQSIAAQTTGMAGLVQQERQVIPLRQAAEAAQRAVNAAQRAEVDAIAQAINAQRALNAARAAAPATVRGTPTAAAAAASTATAVISSGATRSASSASSSIAADAAAAAQRLGLVERAAQSAGSAVQSAGAQSSRALRQTGDDAARAAQSIGTVERAAGALSFGEIIKGAAAFSLIESAARQAGAAVLAIPTTGIKFVAETEVARLGMAGILQSMVEIEGRAPTFAQAQDIAAGAVQRLQKAAAETAASSTDLIATYRGILGPALAAGMSMQQVERFTVVGANAIKSMGLTTGQMVQELRDLTQGGITAAGSTLATALGLKDADTARAKTSSEGLFTFLMKRMEGFASTSDSYSKTLQGQWDALGEKMTQASAKAMAPAAEAAKQAMTEISAAMDGGAGKQALEGIGNGVATLVNTMSGGVRVAQEYGGAITTVAAAYAALKIGGMVSQLQQAGAAKVAAGAAARAAAVSAVLAADADDKATAATARSAAALVAAERVKVQALATQAAQTAATLRHAEAQAATLTGMQRLQAVESQVMPLRQQHAAQTAALEAAQSRLATATRAASAASQAMGAVVGALGGSFGIAIAAATLLVGKLVSIRQEAAKLDGTNLSERRVIDAFDKGNEVSSTDAGRISAAKLDAEEKRDAIAARIQAGRYSMSDRSKGLLGGDSVVEQDRKALVEADKAVARYESLQKRIEAAQAKAAAPGGVALRSGVSSKALDEMLGDVKTTDGLKTSGAERVATLQKLAADERALMVQRGATAQQLAAFDKRVQDGAAGMRRDTDSALAALKKKEGAAGAAGGETESAASRIEKAEAARRMAQLKATAQERTQQLDAELRTAEQRHQMGLTGVSEYEAERVRIQQAKLAERLVLIDAEIAAEEKRTPKDKPTQIQRDQRVIELRADRSAVVADQSAAASGGAAAAAARDLERQRQLAADTAQVWQEAQGQMQSLRERNAAAADALITDPVQRLRVETGRQVAELQRAAGLLSGRLELQLSLTTDPGQRQMLADQMGGIAAETARAVELANDGLAERLKPGWQSMVEGWADANRQMRASSDQMMQSIITGGERAFGEFAKTGKLSLKSLADDLRGQIAQNAYRELIGGTSAGKSSVGLIAGLIGARKGASTKGEGSADFVGPSMPGESQLSDTVARVSESLTGLIGPGTKLTEMFAAAGPKLGDLVGSLASSMSGLFSSGGSGGGGAGGLGGIASLIGSFFGANADGGIFTGAARFAAGGTFTDQIVNRDTHFRYRDAGKMKLGVMGEAGPEAIMPLSGGGAQAVDNSGRKLGHLAVTRGPGGRLSVVLGAAEMAAQRSPQAPARVAAFAAGGTFGGALASASQGQQAAARAGSVTVNAPMHVEIQDMGAVQTLIQRALSAHEKALMQRLRAAGIGIGG